MQRISKETVCNSACFVAAAFLESIHNKRAGPGQRPKVRLLLVQMLSGRVPSRANVSDAEVCAGSKEIQMPFGNGLSCDALQRQRIGG